MPLGMVARSHQRAALHMLDAELFTDLLIPFEDVRVDELLHRQVHPRRLQVLADRHHIDAGISEVFHQRDDFFPGLAEAHHDAALRTQTRSEEHTSELQSRGQLVCRLLLEKKTQYTILY